MLQTDNPSPLLKIKEGDKEYSLYYPIGTNFVSVTTEGEVFSYNSEPILSCGFYQPMPFEDTIFLGVLEGYETLVENMYDVRKTT